MARFTVGIFAALAATALSLETVSAQTTGSERQGEPGASGEARGGSSQDGQGGTMQGQGGMMQGQGGMMQGQGGMMQGQGGMMQGQGMQGSPSRPHVAGNVASVDAKRNEITLDSGRKLTVGTQARILEGGQQISIATLQPGDRVRASFDPQGRVEQIDVMHRAGESGSMPMQQRQGMHEPGTGQGQPAPGTPQPGTPAPSR